MPQSSSHLSSNFPSNFTPNSTLNTVASPMAVASPLTTMPTFHQNGLDATSRTRLQQVVGLMDSTLRLPDNPRAFGVYLLGLLIVFTGAFLHVLVAAQIMQAEVTLARLEEDFHAIEQQNGDIIFQIARDSNLTRLHERVLAHGYVPVQEREYVFRPTTALAAVTPTTPVPPADALAASTLPAATLPAANTGADSAANILPATYTSLSSNLGGQVAQWEEFLFNTFRTATGRAPIAATAGASSNVAHATSASGATSAALTEMSQPVSRNENFWAVWWEQASAQGTKLLDQLRGE